MFRHLYNVLKKCVIIVCLLNKILTDFNLMLFFILCHEPGNQICLQYDSFPVFLLGSLDRNQMKWYSSAISWVVNRRFDRISSFTCATWNSSIDIYSHPEWLLAFLEQFKPFMVPWQTQNFMSVKSLYYLKTSPMWTISPTSHRI